MRTTIFGLITGLALCHGQASAATLTWQQAASSDFSLYRIAPGPAELTAVIAFSGVQFSDSPAWLPVQSSSVANGYFFTYNPSQGGAFFYASGYFNRDGTSINDGKSAPQTFLVPDGAMDILVHNMRIYDYPSFILFGWTYDLRLTYPDDIFSTVPAVVPLPAALPLFAGALGLVAWLGSRGRRRSEYWRELGAR